MEPVVSKSSLFVRIAVFCLAVASLMDAATISSPKLRARDIVEKIASQDYLLVDQTVSSPSNLKEWQWNRSKDGSAVTCSWTFTHDDDVNRKPRWIAKATCNKCAPHCREIQYHHKVLMKSSNSLQTHRTANLSLWKWETVSLPIAFVYDPNV